ncbi:hypothetical protein Y032_0002g944 [Ancylostoma ceylanicum]|nr:hypothetical protein Y032_0002g944 [Ancylostoma ceylanicum]
MLLFHFFCPKISKSKTYLKQCLVGLFRITNIILIFTVTPFLQGYGRRTVAHGISQNVPKLHRGVISCAGHEYQH